MLRKIWDFISNQKIQNKISDLFHKRKLKKITGWKQWALDLKKIEAINHVITSTGML